MRRMTYVVLCVLVGLTFSVMAVAETPDAEEESEAAETGSKAPEKKSQAAETGSEASEAESKVTARVKQAPAEKAQANPVVVLETNYGDIKMELFRKEAPLSTANFLSYIKDGFYDDTIFHRVVKGFVLQAGGVTKDMKQKTQKDPIKNEAKNALSNKRGTISMARTNEIDSGTSHFFLNLVDNTRLDHTGEEPAKYGYAVFGKVVEGMDVVDKIAEVNVGNRARYQNVPLKHVLIEKARIAEKPKAEDTPKEGATKKAVEQKATEMKTLDKKIEKAEQEEAQEEEARDE